jgi:2-dehydro-3-deoxygluconokinase
MQMAINKKRFDLTTFGETMLRLSVPNGVRMENTRSLDLNIGGAETNVCAAISSIGRRCGWISRLPYSALGRNVARALRSDQIDVSAVKWVEGGRVGIYYVEFSTAPRPISVIYDRADSAASHLSSADIDWDYLLDARAIHLTGITAALSPSCYAAVNEAITRARSANVKIVFDVNYRGKLWSPQTARDKLLPLIAQADVLICKNADARLLFGCDADTPEAALRQLKALTRAQTVVSTFGEHGASMLHGDQFASQPALPVQMVDRIGSGDAFAAGIIDGVLDDAPLDGLRRGVALAAIALSQHGDRVMTTRDEMNAVMSQASLAVQR